MSAGGSNEPFMEAEIWCVTSSLPLTQKGNAYGVHLSWKQCRNGQSFCAPLSLGCNSATLRMYGLSCWPWKKKASADICLHLPQPGHATAARRNHSPSGQPVLEPSGAICGAYHKEFTSYTLSRLC